MDSRYKFLNGKPVDKSVLRQAVKELVHAEKLLADVMLHPTALALNATAGKHSELSSGISKEVTITPAAGDKPAIISGGELYDKMEDIKGEITNIIDSFIAFNDSITLSEPEWEKINTIATSTNFDMVNQESFGAIKEWFTTLKETVESKFETLYAGLLTFVKEVEGKRVLQGIGVQQGISDILSFVYHEIKLLISTKSRMFVILLPWIEKFTIEGTTEDFLSPFVDLISELIIADGSDDTRWIKSNSIMEIYDTETIFSWLSCDESGTFVTDTNDGRYTGPIASLVQTIEEVRDALGVTGPVAFPPTFTIEGSTSIKDGESFTIKVTPGQDDTGAAIKFNAPVQATGTGQVTITPAGDDFTITGTSTLGTVELQMTSTDNTDTEVISGIEVVQDPVPVIIHISPDVTDSDNGYTTLAQDKFGVETGTHPLVSVSNGTGQATIDAQDQAAGTFVLTAVATGTVTVVAPGADDVVVNVTKTALAPVADPVETPVVEAHTPVVQPTLSNEEFLNNLLKTEE